VRAAGVTAASLRTKWAHMLPPSKGVLAFYSHSKGAYRSFSNFFVHEGFAFVIPVCCRSAAFTESSRPPVVEGVRFSEKAIMLCKAAVRAYVPVVLQCSWSCDSQRRNPGHGRY